MSNQPYHILLVDDDDVTNFLSREMLRLYMPSPKIDIAVNGQEAVDYLLARAEDPDNLPNLILLDINMPILDGWDFLAEFDKIKKCGIQPFQIYF